MPGAVQVECGSLRGQNGLRKEEDETSGEDSVFDHGGSVRVGEVVSRRATDRSGPFRLTRPVTSIIPKWPPRLGRFHFLDPVFKAALDHLADLRFLL